jgi:hypothetical protein
MIPTVLEPPVTTFANIPRLDNVPGGGTGSSVTFADLDVLLKDPVMVTRVFEDTTDVVAVTLALCAPTGMVTLAGTLTAGLLLASATTAPLP